MLWLRSFMKTTLARTLTLLITAHAALPSGPHKQVIEGAHGTRLPISIVANATRAPIPANVTPQEMKMRLANAGGLLATDVDLVLGDPHLDRNDVLFLVLDTLEL